MYMYVYIYIYIIILYEDLDSRRQLDAAPPQKRPTAPHPRITRSVVIISNRKISN